MTVILILIADSVVVQYSNSVSLSVFKEKIRILLDALL